MDDTPDSTVEEAPADPAADALLVDDLDRDLADIERALAELDAPAPTAD